MYIIVKYGADKELYVNANCAVKNMLSYVKQKTGINLEDTIDLTDAKGIVVGLRKMEPMDNASSKLQHKGIYAALVINEEDGDFILACTPLIVKSHALSVVFYKKLDEARQIRRATIKTASVPDGPPKKEGAKKLPGSPKSGKNGNLLSTGVGDLKGAKSKNRAGGFRKK